MANIRVYMANIRVLYGKHRLCAITQTRG